MMKRLMIIITATAVLFGAAAEIQAKRWPEFMDDTVAFIESGHSLLGHRDIKFFWGVEELWLSEIHRAWGKKGTRRLWEKLDPAGKTALVRIFGGDVQGRKYYFNRGIYEEMEQILRRDVNWVPLKEADLEAWLVIDATAAIKTVESFIHVPDVIDEINITGIPLYKEYDYYRGVLNQDYAGMKEAAFRAARIDFIMRSPVLQEKTEIVIRVIAESLIKHNVTGLDVKKFSPLARTAIKYGEEVVKGILADPVFETFTRNTKRLRAYYLRVMSDEIRTIGTLLEKLAILREKIFERAAEFRRLMDTHSSAMRSFSVKAVLLKEQFAELSSDYRSIDLAGQVAVMPRLQDIKEQVDDVMIDAEQLHARTVAEVEQVLAPGDPASARRFIRSVRKPLNEIYETVAIIKSEMELLARAGGEIRTLIDELSLLQWKLNNMRKDCRQYHDFFRRGILRTGLPSFDSGDTSGALAGRPGMHAVSTALAYSYGEVHRLSREYRPLEKLFFQQAALIEKYPAEELATSQQRNELKHAQDILVEIDYQFVKNRYFESVIEQMNDDLDLFAVDERDLLDMVRGRPHGLHPEFIETIEGHGRVPVTK